MIRNFEISDAPEVVRIHNKYIENFEFKLTEDFIINACSKESFKMFVFCDSKVLGFAGFLFLGLGRAEIGPVAIDSPYRRQKIGESLMTAAINFMRQRSVKRVISKIKSSNTESIKFFMSLGFTPEGIFENYTPENETIIQMVRFI